MDFVNRHMVMQEVGEALTRSIREDPNFAADLDEALECVRSAVEELPKSASAMATPRALARGREAVLELAVACIRALEPSRWERPNQATAAHAPHRDGTAERS